MVTFKPIIVPGARRRDGRYCVYIRIYQKGKTRRVPTTLTAGPSDLTRTLKLKSANILSKAGDLIERMREPLADVPPFVLDEWDVDKVVEHIRAGLTAQTFRLDFFTFGEEYARGKGAQTAKSYLGALNALERFLGERRLDVNDITRAMLLEFVDHIEAEPKMHRKTAKSGAFPTKRQKIPGGASSRHIAKLAHIYGAARDRYNDEDAGRILIPRSPFNKIPRKQPQPQGQRALEEDVLVRVFAAEGRGSLEGTALDAFRLSFLTMGANLADLYRAKPFTGDEWRYHRKKTETRRADGAEIRVALLPEALEVAARLQEGPRGWWLPALHRLGKDADTCTAVLNRGLASWADREGIPRFTFYAARHTFATLARRLGIEKATVDECLGHKGDYALLDIYAERAWGLVAKANAKVVRYLYDKIAGLSST